MIGLLDVANVVQVGIIRGNGFDALGCALHSEVANTCSPIVRDALTGTAGDASGLDRNMFAVLTSLESRAQCSPGTEEDVVREAIAFETEKAAGKVLWGLIGDNAADVSLTAATVGTVVAGANNTETLGDLLVAFWGRATGVKHSDTIIHLGVDPLLDLTSKGVIEGGVIKNLEVRVASSPGYPQAGIAVTGPITIELGPPEVLASHDTAVNDLLAEANRLGAIQFDPCTAVRVA